MGEDYVTVPLYKLTTIDNPFHPVNERDKWERYDLDKGYNTDAYLARVAGYTDLLSETEQRRCENKAIDDIIRLDLECRYKKVLIEE